MKIIVVPSVTAMDLCSFTETYLRGNWVQDWSAIVLRCTSSVVFCLQLVTATSTRIRGLVSKDTVVLRQWGVQTNVRFNRVDKVT